MIQTEKKENKKKSPKITPAPTPEITPTPSELSAEEEKIKHLESQLSELKKWKEENLHKLADQLNHLKAIEERKAREIKEVENYGKQKLLTKIVDFIVNLESRVVKAMRDYPDPQGIVLSQAEGIEITLNNLKKDLEKEGVREIPIKVGESLRDSLLHKCKEQVSSKKPPGTILEVVEKGYLLHDRVIRPAEVKISKLETEKSKKN
ncbi:MAG: nucleotide exchange factor GrpE [Candidatus Moeniiplasma glomeromycotorum]|nr:nucleotide exchange factor GrpE [Candidatus Moeniiplasma glomeromycotorum]MCE8167757.1 nucleotide exchange factor GrpE [Candidatus Moeniiplasma glomeromycotorum]MCE8169157.1 nucleotide exchange factor GrpE [Candidatus Moeniiplasma glomeromycotorum]